MLIVHVAVRVKQLNHKLKKMIKKLNKMIKKLKMILFIIMFLETA